MKRSLLFTSSFDLVMLTSFLLLTFFGEVNSKAIAPTSNEAKIVPMVFVRDISVIMTTL